MKRSATPQLPTSSRLEVDGFVGGYRQRNRTAGSRDRPAHTISVVQRTLREGSHGAGADVRLT